MNLHSAWLIPPVFFAHETRVLSQREFLGAIGRSKSISAQPSGGDDKPPIILASSNLKPFIPKELAAASTPMPFQPPDGGRSAYGYRATQSEPLSFVTQRRMLNGSSPSGTNWRASA